MSRQTIVNKYDYMVPDEAKAITSAVQLFSADMHTKMIKKMEKGYGGWDSPDDFEIVELMEKFKEHFNTLEETVFGWKAQSKTEAEVRQTAVDVANFAMMVWNRFPDPEVEKDEDDNPIVYCR